MKKHFTKYIYLFFLFSQITLALILVLLLLDIDFNIFIKDINTSSLLLRLILYGIFQIFLFKFAKPHLKKKTIYGILSLISFTILLDGIGNIFGWYDVGGILGKIQFDDILHLICPLILTITIYLLFSNIKQFKRNANLLSFTVISSLICIWEIYEYWSDVLFNTTMVGGLEDTVLDMTLGVGGALLALLFIKIYHILFSAK